MLLCSLSSTRKPPENQTAWDTRCSLQPLTKENQSTEITLRHRERNRSLFMRTEVFLERCCQILMFEAMNPVQLLTQILMLKLDSVWTSLILLCFLSVSLRPRSSRPHRLMASHLPSTPAARCPTSRVSTSPPRCPRRSTRTSRAISDPPLWAGAAAQATWPPPSLSWASTPPMHREATAASTTHKVRTGCSR